MLTATVLFAGVRNVDDEKLEGCEFSEEMSLYMCSKLKDRAPLNMLASSRFRNRLLHSLSLPGRRSLTSPSGGRESKGGREGELDTSEVQTDENHQESTYEHLAEDRPSGGGGVQFKSRSQSFSTDTTTSGISSMSSSPSRETLCPTTATECISLNTVMSAHTIHSMHSLTPGPCSKALSIPKSCSTSLIPPGSSHTLPRRAQSLRSPSPTTLCSVGDYSLLHSSSRETLGYATHNGCTSPRDALGYAMLKRLQHQRIQPSLSHSDALASPAEDILFTEAITMNTNSPDSRLTSRRYM